MKKDKAYIDYTGNFEDNFNRFVEKPQTLIETRDGFSGRISGKSFWFCKKYPFVTNSFRVILYGEIMDDHQICFGYRKAKGTFPFIVFVDIIMLIFSVILISNKAQAGNWEMAVFPVVICAALTMLTLIYPKREKEILSDHLKKICNG